MSDIVLHINIGQPVFDVPSIVKVMTKFTKTNYLSLDFFYAVLVFSDLQPVHMLVSKLVPFYTELHLAYNLLTEYHLTSIH